MQNLQIDLKMATAHHHQTNGQTERRIRTIRQCLRSFTNLRGDDWLQYLPQVQLAINTAAGDSTNHSPFEIVFGRKPYLLPTAKVSATSVPSADEYASNLMRIQQEARHALEIARARQTRLSQSRLKPAPPLIPGQDEALVLSAPYLGSVEGRKKITSPWLGPFDILEGPDENDNYKLGFDYGMQHVHPWVSRQHLKRYTPPDDNMFPSQRYSRPEPIQIEGEPQWVVEKVVSDRTKRNKIQFLVHWKGYPEHEATWEPLDHMAGAEEAIEEYWQNQYGESLPFTLPFMHPVQQSNWTCENPMLSVLPPLLVPEHHWTDRQDSELEEDTQELEFDSANEDTDEEGMVE
jgi:hypothetical protein